MIRRIGIAVSFAGLIVVGLTWGLTLSGCTLHASGSRFFHDIEPQGSAPESAPRETDVRLSIQTLGSMLLVSGGRRTVHHFSVYDLSHADSTLAFLGITSELYSGSDWWERNAEIPLLYGLIVFGAYPFLLGARRIFGKDAPCVPFTIATFAALTIGAGWAFSYAGDIDIPVLRHPPAGNGIGLRLSGGSLSLLRFEPFCDDNQASPDGYQLYSRSSLLNFGTSNIVSYNSECIFTKQIPFWQLFSLFFGAALYPALVCRRPARRFRTRRQRLRENLCLKCGYSLQGLPEPRCPECNTAFDPSSLSEA